MSDSIRRAALGAALGLLGAGCGTMRWAYEPDLAASLAPGVERSSISLSYPVAPEGDRTQGTVTLTARGVRRREFLKTTEAKVEVVFQFENPSQPVRFAWDKTRLYDPDLRPMQPSRIEGGEEAAGGDEGGGEVAPDATTRRTLVFELPKGRPWRPIDGFKIVFEYDFGRVTVVREGHFLQQWDPYVPYNDEPHFHVGLGAVWVR